MKIFNWVHRRFTNSKAQNGANMNPDDDDEQFERVVEKDSSNVLFEGWSGGILTIGTFGYDNTQYNLLPVSFEEDEEKKKSDQVEHESDRNHQNTHHPEEEEEDEEYEMEGKTTNLQFEYARMKKIERTTLADLLSADHRDDDDDHHHHLPPKQQILIEDIVNLANCKTMNKNSSDNGLSLDSKQLIRARRPIDKLHQLMKRMLKKKIHPHLNSQLLPKCHHMTDDYASLLPTDQDAII